MGIVTVKALDSFYGNEEGQVHKDQVVPLNDIYARDLERRGLVTIAAEVVSEARADGLVRPDLKAKPAPSNKMLPSPTNKAA